MQMIMLASKLGLPLSTQEKKINILYFITVAWALITIWIAPHLPLADLPQHAAQVALIKDLLLNQSEWSNIFQVNYLTPYITTYGIAILLSFFVSVSTAFKILISINYLAFIYICIQLRKHFKIDSRMDWLFILPFFGFSYQYGFISYLLAVPIGLWFILLADRYAQNPTKSSAFILIIVGALLLESHGLMFVFSLGVGGLILLLRIRKVKYLLYFLPYLILLITFSIMFIANAEFNAKLGLLDYTLSTRNNGFSLFNFITNLFTELPKRLSQAYFYNLAGSKISISPFVHTPAILLLILSPWLFGLRINWQNKTPLIIFSSLVLLFISVPVYTFGTYFIYQRFSILIIPSYVLLFTKTSYTEGLSTSNLTRNSTLMLLILTCWGVLSFNSAAAWGFRQESTDINNIISSLEPGHKAVSIIYNPISEANNKSLAYVHYPLWYQAEKHGLVYPNFAVYAPMPARFNQKEMYDDVLTLDTDGDNGLSFDWAKQHGENFRYFFVRNYALKDTRIPKIIFKNAPCQPKIIAKKGRWVVYEKAPCTNP